MRSGERRSLTSLVYLVIGTASAPALAQAVPPSQTPPPAPPAAAAPGSPAAPPPPPVAQSPSPAPPPPAAPAAPPPYAGPFTVAPAPTEQAPAAAPAAPPTVQTAQSVHVDVQPTAPPAAPESTGREGFFLSVGLGHSLTRWLVDELESVEQADGSERTYERRSADTELGLATTLQLGYTLPNGLNLHLAGRMAWLTTSDLGDRGVVMTGVSGAGVTYFFNPQAPSVYVSGELGLSYWSRLDDYFNVGFGACGAAGYEFSKHWSVEQSYCWGTAKEEVFDGDRKVAVGGKPFVAALTFNFLYY